MSRGNETVKPTFTGLCENRFSHSGHIIAIEFCFLVVKHKVYLSISQQNAVRHTLSLRKRFVRVPDPKRPYKSMWTISGDYQRIHLKEKRSHLEDKRSHSKNRRRSTETRQEIRQPVDLDGALRLWKLSATKAIDSEQWRLVLNRLLSNFVLKRTRIHCIVILIKIY